MKRIAIIGSGISGLTCAHFLKNEHHVSLFEAGNYLGGHTATVDIEHLGQPYAIDTGFIVCNDHTYPNFLKLLSSIGINIKPTQMSFSVHHAATGLEYNGHTLNSLFAQRRNLFKPSFYRFVGQILRFNRLAKARHKQLQADATFNSEGTLGDFLSQHGFSESFRQQYILPMVAAIWSASTEDANQFDLVFFLKFFVNHGLLNIINRPQWYVIENGSRSYIPKLTQGLTDIRLNTPVLSVVRKAEGVTIITQGKEESFDEVVFACHSDQALALLADANAQEHAILNDIEYRENEVVLHTDTAVLPERKLAWASWNYWLEDQPSVLPRLTYNMNILQGIESDTTFCVTLNQSESIDPSKVLRRFSYAHPAFTQTALLAQKRRTEITNKNHSHFCGAYWYNGFHEDGVRSALDVCQNILGDKFTWNIEAL